MRAALVIVWLLAAGSTAGLLWLGYGLSRRVERPAASRAAARYPLPARRQSASPWARWTITGQLSAHHVLIVQIETWHLDEAMAIAKQVADPLKSRYAEVLIYFHRPGRPDTLPPRRVQWTRASGWVETIY